MPVALTKRELVKRAAKWGAPRGFELRDSLLNAWIDEGLVDEGDRGGNVGKRPVYRYSCRHYRRVLLVLKLYSRGIRSRDQILIMLFLNGHGVKPFEVREPIAREFGRARAKLNALMRSSRFDEEGQVPPKHKESLVRSLGPGDERFVKAGVILPADQMIAAVRAARSPDPESKLRTIMSSGPDHSKHDRWRSDSCLFHFEFISRGSILVGKQEPITGNCGASRRFIGLTLSARIHSCSFRTPAHPSEAIPCRQRRA